MAVPKRIATALLNSLKGGVVPRVGLPHVAVGRDREIAALLHDIGIAADGGAAFRFIVGKYGSGKSFLLHIIRNYAMDRDFVVVDADLSPERRLHGTKGQGLSTYRELIRNMSTKTRPEGGALTLILDRWLSKLQTEALTESGRAPDDPALVTLVEGKIRDVIGSISEMVHGFDFATLLSRYYQGHAQGDDEVKNKVVKWFRGEYATKSEARTELGVGIIVSDDDWYDYLKLFALFLKNAGYNGLLVLIDELVNIYKIPNSITRQYNYEKLLTMYNDALQGKARHLGIIFGGTPQCVEDPRRGLFSYEALKSRLAEGRFSRADAQDMLAPIIRLAALTHEEMLVLTEKLAAIHAGLFEYRQILTTEDMLRFIQVEFGRIGADTNITPREVIRDFIEILNITWQHPQVSAASLLEGQDFAFAKPDLPGGAAEGRFEEFEL